MCLGEERKFTFDISEAGPGKLTTFSKPKSSTLLEEIPLEQTGAYKFRLAFKPKACGKYFGEINDEQTNCYCNSSKGDYELFVYFENLLLPKMPIQTVVSENTSDGATVVLKGHGLAGARVGEETEIIIDGKDAGDGEPEVTLTGVKSDIKVKLNCVGPRLYKAVYTPRLPGESSGCSKLCLNVICLCHFCRNLPFECSVESKASERVSTEDIHFAQL